MATIKNLRREHFRSMCQKAMMKTGKHVDKKHKVKIYFDRTPDIHIVVL